MKRKNSRMILVFLCILTLIALSGIAGANPILITPDPANQYLQEMDEQHVVYTDNRAGNLDIWMYDILTGETTQITNDLADQFDPDVSGNYIIFSDRRNPDADIYLYDIRSGVSKDLTDFLIGDQLLTAIDGDYVVWTDFGVGNADLYLYRISSGDAQKITDDPANQRRPAISGNYIVYEDDRNGNSDIYLYDISSGVEKQITTDPLPQRNPAISGTNVVYEDYRFGNADVFLYNITTGETRQITSDVSQQTVPDIDGNIIVFNSNQYGIGDIMMYDISTGATERITETGEKLERNPSVAGYYIIYESYADGDADIWLYTINRPPVANAGPDQIVNLNSVVTLDGSLSSDPDNNPLTYTWCIITKPAYSTATLSDITAQKPTFTADKIGEYTIQLIVNDGFVDSTTATVTIRATQLALTVPVDIEPGLCPNVIGINMKGPILIVAIPGTKDLDAKKIDPATITLSREGIPGTVKPRYNKVLDIATPYSITSYCSCQRKLWDGTKDLVLVFDVGEVITNLQLKSVIGQTIPFVVQGSLKPEYGKTPLSGSDCMKVLSVSNERIWQNI